MDKFTAYNPVKLQFGKDCLAHLPKELEGYKKVLFIYGKSSIKRSGLYDEVMKQLAGIEVIEYSGIKPNPIVEQANEAAALGKANDVDAVIAVGGGSVIDSAKMIALGIKADHSVWDFMIGKEKPQAAVPIFAVLTLAATGTEMNPFAVLQNHEAKMKIGFGNPLMFPKVSYLDPNYTISVPQDYTAYGIVDLLAHSLEAYFGEGFAPLPDKFIYSIFLESMEIGEPLLKDLESYELRARMMYAATMALNGTTSHGRISGDWGVHSIGHVLSLLYDTPHGATLSIAYPAWLKLMSERIPERIVEFGMGVFNVDSVEETIAQLEYLFKRLGSPIRLAEINLGDEHKEEIITQFGASRIGGAHHNIMKEDYDNLFELMK